MITLKNCVDGDLNNNLLSLMRFDLHDRIAKERVNIHILNPLLTFNILEVIVYFFRPN